jgi:hypothetical protein
MRFLRGAMAPVTAGVTIDATRTAAAMSIYSGRNEGGTRIAAAKRSGPFVTFKRRFATQFRRDAPHRCRREVW